MLDLEETRLILGSAKLGQLKSYDGNPFVA